MGRMSEALSFISHIKLFFFSLFFFQWKIESTCQSSAEVSSSWKIEASSCCIFLQKRKEYNPTHIVSFEGFDECVDKVRHIDDGALDLLNQPHKGFSPLFSSSFYSAKLYIRRKIIIVPLFRRNSYFFEEQKLKKTQIFFDFSGRKTMEFSQGFGCSIYLFLHWRNVCSPPWG